MLRQIRAVLTLLLSTLASLAICSETLDQIVTLCTLRNATAFLPYHSPRMTHCSYAGSVERGYG